MRSITLILLLSLLAIIVLMTFAAPARLGATLEPALNQAVDREGSKGAPSNAVQDKATSAPSNRGQSAERDSEDQKQQSGSPARAQDKEGQDEEAVRLSSQLVLVPLSVSDASGQPVKDLKAEDIVIEEDGKPQKVVTLGEPGKTPVDIALLFDVSGSIHGEFVFEQQAATRFIKEVLKPGDAVSLFAIGITPRRVQERTENPDSIMKAILSLSASNEPTAFFDAIVQAARYLDEKADPASRRVMVAISDGEENYSLTSNLKDALDGLQRKDCLFYSINPSGPGIRLNKISLRGQSVMESMASQTGGKAFVPANIGELDSDFHQIADELQAQYLFGYYTPDDETPGFKRITVLAPKRPDLRIRTRQGYYARGSAPAKP